MSCLLIAMVAVPALRLVGDSSQSKRMQSEQSFGMELARELMSEIVQSRYAEPTTEGGETRSTYDDVTDYNGLTELNPTDRSGTAIAGATGWRRSVAVRLVTLAAPATTSATDVGLKEIVVTVTSPTGRVMTLTALRSNVDGYERRSVTADTYASTVDITVDTGSTGGTVTTSVNTVNLVP